jgi:hypothetical protein
MSVWMLRDVIWTRFFTKPICWQNSFFILEKLYLPNTGSFLDELLYIDRSLSQESKNIKFASNGCLYLKIFKSEWSKVNTGRLRDLTFKVAISMLLLFFYFLSLYFQKGMDVIFVIPLESLHLDL